MAADRLHAPPLSVVRDLGRDHHRRGSLARHQGAEPRDRLQGRHPGDLQDAEAGLADGRPQPGKGHRPERRGHPGPRKNLRQRQLRELPDADEVAVAG